MLQCTPEATVVHIYPINNYEWVNLLLMIAAEVRSTWADVSGTGLLCSTTKRLSASRKNTAP